MTDKKSYHQPKLHVYGNIRVMTQAMGRSTIGDNPVRPDSRTA